MGKIWCKQCLVFFGESAIEKTKHEKSSKHQYALNKQLRELHAKNKIESKELHLANKELTRINRELGIFSKNGNGNINKVHKPTRSSKPKQLDSVKVAEKVLEKVDESPPIAEWQPVSKPVTLENSVIEDIAIPAPAVQKSFKETEGQKEVNNWDLDRVRTIEVEKFDDDDDNKDDDGLGKITFKKRKFIKK